MNPPFLPERRKRVRVKVRWPLLLFRDDAAEAIESVTQDLSSMGFYCLSPKPFAAGESLVCALKVPMYDPIGEERTIAVECRVRVVRTEETGDGGFGIACQIEDYHLAPVEDLLAKKN
jgi:hypothetical protein